MPNIAPKLHPVERDFIDRVVCASLRRTHRFAQSGNA